MKRCGLLIAVILALLAFSRDTSAQKEATEDEAKAAYIINFGKYVEWPIATLPNADTPLVIGVLGDDSIVSLIRTLVGTKTVNGHKVVVNSLRWPKTPKNAKELRDSGVPKDSKEFKEFKDCHMLYIAQSESARGDELIRLMRGIPTLLIADFPNFARHGGHINFILDVDHILLEVNPESARQSDLTISSRLLGNAKPVQTGPSWR